MQTLALMTGRDGSIRMCSALAGALIVCACVLPAPTAGALETMRATLKFSPDRLGASTNVSGTTTLTSTGADVPSPTRKVTVYFPAGMRINVTGAGTCTAARLQLSGPSGCAADSRIGFGGGTGALEIGNEIIRGPYTLDLFLAPSQNGHLVVLAYASAASPVSGQIIVEAREISAPKPYGIGFTGEIPLIPTLPEAPDGSVASAFLTFGDSNVSYYKRVRGTRKLVHVPGIIAPHTCPKGGFPYEISASLLDGTQLTSTGTIPCPHR